jgi:hypothetical protein
MNVCDFGRSFLNFGIDLKKKRPKTMSQEPPFTLNSVRMPLECRCWITPAGAPAGHPPLEYVLTASCKTEQVNVAENIWHEPNADMCMVASAVEFLVVKSWDRNNRGVKLWPSSLGDQPERQSGLCGDAFDFLRIDVRQARASVLETTQQIIETTLANRPLVSHTEYTAADGTRVRIEYPVKVINVSPRDGFYQVDTGPVLVPDPDAFDGQHAISALRHAYVAHNSLGCTEFVVNVPTPVGQGVSVNHYSNVLKVKAVNRMLEVLE